MREVYSIENPNFSIILPGKCSANCNFCFGKNKKETLTIEEFKVELREVLKALPEQFKTISITGSEPTESKYLIPVLEELHKYIVFIKDFDRVVLATNGMHLNKLLNEGKNALLFEQVLTHVNISRHHYNHFKNSSVFNVDEESRNVPCTLELKNIKRKLEAFGIETSLSFVYDDSTFNLGDMEQFIAYAKNVGVTGLRCRYNQMLAGGLGPSALEDEYLQYEIVDESSCPVCRHKVQLIDGILVTWIYSVLEPSTSINAVYELVFQNDGRLTADWNGLTEVVL